MYIRYAASLVFVKRSPIKLVFLSLNCKYTLFNSDVMCGRKVKVSSQQCNG